MMAVEREWRGQSKPWLILWGQWISVHDSLNSCWDNFSLKQSAFSMKYCNLRKKAPFGLFILINRLFAYLSTHTHTQTKSTLQMYELALVVWEGFRLWQRVNSKTEINYEEAAPGVSLSILFHCGFHIWWNPFPSRKLHVQHQMEDQNWINH